MKKQAFILLFICDEIGSNLIFSPYRIGTISSENWR